MNKTESIKVFVVEDESITVATMQQSLEEAGYIFCGSADEAEPALQLIHTSQPDIVILDINLIGEKDGVWLAEKINERFKLPFIFLTSFGDKSSIERAVRTRPCGYLIKPFDEQDLFDSIAVALSNFSKSQVIALPDEQKKSEEVSDSFAINDSIFVRHNNLFTKVNFKDILYIVADKNYVDVITESKRLTVRSTLKEMTANLPKGKFQQINRSSLVNMDRVDSFGKDLVIIHQHELSLSENFKDEFVRGIKTLRN